MSSTLSPNQFLPHRTDELCPCCNSGLQKVQRDLVRISGLVARPLSEQLQASIGPLIADVRDNGRLVLDALRRCFEEGRVPTYPQAYEDSVVRLGRGIDALAVSGGVSGITEAGVFHLYALRFAFAQLARDMRELVDELSIRKESHH
jgi:hypothetical protein